MGPSAAVFADSRFDRLAPAGQCGAVSDPDCQNTNITAFNVVPGTRENGRNRQVTATLMLLLSTGRRCTFFFHERIVAVVDVHLRLLRGLAWMDQPKMTDHNRVKFLIFLQGAGFVLFWVSCFAHEVSVCSLETKLSALKEILFVSL